MKHKATPMTLQAFLIQLKSTVLLGMFYGRIVEMWVQFHHMVKTYSLLSVIGNEFCARFSTYMIASVCLPLYHINYTWFQSMFFVPKLFNILASDRSSWRLSLICHSAYTTQNKLLNSCRPQSLHT